MPLAEAHVATVEDYLRKEVGAGCLLGPFAAISLHFSRFAMIPKGHTHGG